MDSAAPPTAIARPRVALLDERPGESSALVSWLERHSVDLALVVVATSWAELVQSPAFPADVAVLDLAPTGPVSLEARVRSCRSAGVVVVGLASSDAEAELALPLGIELVVHRDVAGPVFVAELRRALGRDGEHWRPSYPTPLDAQPRLSAGELTALKLYASGLSTAEVARAMEVQYETAKTYLRRVREKYAKVGRPASKKIELIRRATEDGIVE